MFLRNYLKFDQITTEFFVDFLKISLKFKIFPKMY